MDQEPEDWEEKKRIKAEISKAEMANNKESAEHLAELGAEAFSPKKGFSREAEDFRRSGENFAWTSVSLAVLGLVGVIGTKLMAKTALGAMVGTIDSIVSIAIFVAAAFSIAGIVAAAIYVNKTGKDAKHILASSIVAIVIVALWAIIRFKM